MDIEKYFIDHGDTLKAISWRKSTMQQHFCKIPTIFKPNLNLWGTDILSFLKNPLCLNLLPSLLQNKTIIVQSPVINICFWNFQNHAKIGDSVLLMI